MSIDARTWMLTGMSPETEDSSSHADSGLRLTPSGGIRMQHGDAAVRQAIMVLLTTLPGERVMRPDYGCPLNRLMFSPNDATTAGLAIHYIHAALSRWEPRIDILRLDAGSNSVEGRTQEGHLFVSLEYRVRASNRVDVFEIALGLNGDTY